MLVRAICPGCSRRYKLQAEHAGRKFRCKECQATVSVPVPRAASRDAVVAERDRGDFAAEALTAPRTTGARGAVKVVAIAVAVVYACVLLSGWFWPAIGSALMLAGSLAGIAVALCGVVLFFLGLKGRQRFMMALKILLRFVGIKLITFDASLWNPQTKRATLCLLSGMAVFLACFFPASYFRSLEGASAVAADVDPAKRQTTALSSEASASPGRTHAPPGAFGPGSDPMPPPYGPPPYGPPAGFPPPPPVFFFYESLEHSPEQTLARLDRELQGVPIYVPGSVRISERERKISLQTSQLPDARFLPAITAALEAAGVTRHSRR